MHPRPSCLHGKRERESGLMWISTKKLGPTYVLLIASLMCFAGEAMPAGLGIYQYDPHVVTLTGVLDTRIFPGAPNYESVKKGDRPNKVWLIKLPRPISMDPGPDPTSFNESETGIEEIQVILTDLKGEEALKKYTGGTVTFTGTIFHAHTVHHPLPLLMDVQSYKFHTSKRRD